MRELEQLRQYAARRLDREGVAAPLLMRSALATVERAQKLHDRLKARGLLGEERKRAAGEQREGDERGAPHGVSGERCAPRYAAPDRAVSRCDEPRAM